MPKKSLDESQIKAASVLARGLYTKGEKRRRGIVKKAADAAGVARRTIYDWLKADVFVREIETRKTEVDDAAFVGLKTLLKGNDKVGPDGVTTRWYIVNRYPEIYDDSLRRMKVKHEMEMQRQKLANQGYVEAAKSAPQIIINSDNEVPGIPEGLEHYEPELDEKLN